MLSTRAELDSLAEYDSLAMAVPASRVPAVCGPRDAECNSGAECPWVPRYVMLGVMFFPNPPGLALLVACSNALRLKKKMDSLVTRLAAVENEIKQLVIEKTRLQGKERQGIITDDEEIVLAGLVELLSDARASAKRYESIMKIAIKDEPIETKSFSDADRKWIQEVTGVDTSYRRWTDFTVDVNVVPRPGFQTKFEEVAKAFHQLKEAGRRVFLNLFLSDIILRPEFEESLRIFPELEVSVAESRGAKKRVLSGRTDYTVGFSKGTNIFDNTIPREVHLVAVEAKTNIGEQDLWRCVAEAASLYKTHLDAGKANNRM